MEWWQGALRCPVCGAAVHREGKSLWCEGVRRHCVDFSAEGYLNLAPARQAGDVRPDVASECVSFVVQLLPFPGSLKAGTQFGGLPVITFVH